MNLIYWIWLSLCLGYVFFTLFIEGGFIWYRYVTQTWWGQRGCKQDDPSKFIFSFNPIINKHIKEFCFYSIDHLLALNTISLLASVFIFLIGTLCISVFIEQPLILLFIFLLSGGYGITILLKKYFNLKYDLEDQRRENV